MISFKWRRFQKELVHKRGVVDHSTLNRWVIHYAPVLEDKFRRNYKRQIGGSWHMTDKPSANKIPRGKPRGILFP